MDLVRAALQLPDAEVGDEAIDDPLGLDADCLAVASNVSRLVGQHQVYWEVFDPRVEEAPVTGSLVDDLSNIYRDLN